MIWLIIFLGLGIVCILYEAITKRELGDDIEDFNEKVSDFFDKDDE